MSSLYYARKDYTEEKVSTQEYYEQFVNQKVLMLVKQKFGERLFNTEDAYFNDIPQKDWEDLAEALIYASPETMRRLEIANGTGEGISLSDRVVVLKAAATKVVREQI